MGEELRRKVEVMAVNWFDLDIDSEWHGRLDDRAARGSPDIQRLERNGCSPVVTGPWPGRGERGTRDHIPIPPKEDDQVQEYGHDECIAPGRPLPTSPILRADIVVLAHHRLSVGTTGKTFVDVPLARMDRKNHGPRGANTPRPADPWICGLAEEATGSESAPRR